jgi:hypothetical protein
VTPIDVFPDDVLLEIFDLYVDENPEAWQSLVHVCRRWRCLVFASPRRLNLRIVCTLGTPVRDRLEIWPALPLLVQGHIHEASSLDNFITALGHRNRVSGINLWDLASSQLTKVWAAMKEPFPELLDLRLRAFDRIAPLEPHLFMGGSTPRLRYLQLERIPFPGLPNFLLSATHLVSLRLYDIPHIGYISPEAMVTCLSMLTSLETLCLEIRSLPSHLDLEGQRLPFPTRSVLPALMYFHFRGVSEYLEDLTSRVDVPRLNNVSINFTYEIEFDNPQLAQLISRTSTLKAPDEAHVIFDDSAGWVTLSSKTSGPGQFNVEISCGALEWQLPALTRVCNLSLPPLFTVEDLYICENPGSRLNWDCPMESEEWLELLKPFTSVKNLYLSDGLRQRIVPALRLLVGDRVTEVLPTLESIFLEGPRPSSPYKEEIGQFISPPHPPNFNSYCLRPAWDPLWLDHEQDFTAPPPTPQLDWQFFSLDGPQLSGPFQEDIQQFISPQQPDPQNLHLDCIQPSGLLDEGSQQHSSTQLPTLYNLYSEESQRSRHFQEGSWSDPQNVHLDWLQPSGPFHADSGQQFSAQSSTLQDLYSVELQPSRPFQEGDRPDLQNPHLDWSLPSEPFHGDSGQHSSAQSSTLQNLYSVESQLSGPFQEGDWSDLQNLHMDCSLPSEPLHGNSEQHSSAQSSTLQNLYSVESQLSGPFQEGDWPELQNLHVDWSLPSGPFHENSQYTSAHSPTMQNFDSEDSQPSRPVSGPLQEGCWPDPQNFHLGGSQPSGLFQWEESIGQFAAARQKTTHPITVSFWDRKYERVKR